MSRCTYTVRLKFSTHFQIRMLQRNIQIDDLKKTIINPDRVRNSFGGREVATKKFVGKTLEVVYFRNQIFGKRNEYRIITAYTIKEII